jgi:hypothetical protein
MKGAEDVEQIVGHNRESPDVVALPVVDDNISDSPTPLSEPLKLDALTEAVLLLGTEVAIPKRKRETTIALGKLRKNGGE